MVARSSTCKQTRESETETRMGVSPIYKTGICLGENRNLYKARLPLFPYPPPSGTALLICTFKRLYFYSSLNCSVGDIFEICPRIIDVVAKQEENHRSRR